MTDPLDAEDLLARYLTEHMYDASLVGDTFEIHVGSLSAPHLCEGCLTPLVHVGQGEWRHAWGLAERGGCVTPVPWEGHR